MSFTDFWFYPKTAVLLVILLIVQALFRRRATVANTLSKLLLLAYSFYTLIFYNWQFAVYLGGVVLITYVAAILVDHFEKNVKKRTMVLSIVLLLLILGIFKYLNFFAGSFARVAGLAWTDLNIVLPLGISFYIFSAISYIVDVYWGLLPADRNLLNVALFLAFFPKLTCGPIVKGRDFLPQLQQYRHITRAGFEQGIQIFAFGLFKKMVLADHLGVFVDDVFRVPVAYNTGSIIWSALSYSLQIYFDFSGYSDMAVGLSKILGYELPRNFNLPYIAHDVSDFWGRWHISLSDWFKTYVYIPLGGSRKGKGRTYFNLFIVMLLSGLWHGAGWTFIAWGGFYGAWNCIHRLLKTHHVKVTGILAVPGTFVLVSLLWVVFRALSFHNAAQMFAGMFTVHTGLNQPYYWTFFAIGILIFAELIAVHKAGQTENSSDSIDGFYPIQDLRSVKGLTLFFTLCGLIIILGYFGKTYFIYGQF